MAKVGKIKKSLQKYIINPLHISKGISHNSPYFLEY